MNPASAAGSLCPVAAHAAVTAAASATLPPDPPSVSGWPTPSQPPSASRPHAARSASSDQLPSAP
jgi:hypothetical protein